MTKPEISNDIVVEEAKVAAKKWKGQKRGMQPAQTELAIVQEDDTDTDQSIQDCIIIGLQFSSIL